jgi:hypothetical protein
MATIAPPAARMRSDRIFYSTMGLVVAAVTIWGFARSFYLSRWFAAPQGTPELTSLLYLHGFVFTGWVALMVVQPLLIARRQLPLHRTLGYLGAGLAAAMFVLGNLAAIAAMQVGFIGLGDPLDFYAVPFFAINSFAVTVALAVYWRHRAETHKRLMLLSNVGLLGAAVARIPLELVQAGSPFTFIFLPNLITIAGIVYDLRTRGRVHKVWIWGGLAMLASQLILFPLMGSAPWRGFAATTAGFWPV